MTLKLIKISLTCVMLIGSLSVSAQKILTRPDSNNGSQSSNKPKVAATLTVSGQNEVASLNFPESGGRMNLSVSTNQSKVEVSDVPAWVSVYASSKTSLSVGCESNSEGMTRSGSFNVTAGNKTVRVDVTQPGRMPQITGLKFGNATWDGDYIDEPGTTLYAEKMRYFSPTITYNGSTATVKKTLYVKLIEPSGSVRTVDSSPDGYTYIQNVTFLKGNNRSQGLIALGSDQQSNFAPGTYTLEIYCDGNMIFSNSVHLH